MLRTSMTPWQIQMQHHAKKLGPAPLVQVNSCCNTDHALIFYLEVWGLKKHTLLSHTATWIPWELTEHWCYTLKPAKTSQKNSSLMGNIIYKDVWELGLKGLVWCLNWDLMHSCHWVSLLPNVHFFCLADTLQTSKPSKAEEMCSRWGSNRLHPRNLWRMRTVKQTFPLSY